MVNIYCIYYFPNLAKFCNVSAPMKISLRPIFTVVIFIAIFTTLTCKTLVQRSFRYLNNSSLSHSHLHSDLNPTLLRYAEIDLAEDQVKQEVTQLLEGNFGASRGYRGFNSWKQFRHLNVKLKSSSGRIDVFHIRSPMFYRMWLKFRDVLSDWFRNKRFEPKIMYELTDLVKKTIDGEPIRRYASCAVVGNSGILLKTKYGELIDSHEGVIRLNNARIEEFQRNVGSKTSISFINSNILHLCTRKIGCFCHPYGEKVPIVMYACQPVHFMDYLLCNSSFKAPLLVTDARFDVLCARIVKYYSLKRFVEETGKHPEEWGPTHDGSMFHYSSGMQAVMLALGICDSVSIFGFGKSVIAKHHYHTNQKVELHLHDYEAEYAFYRDLVERPQVIPFLMDNFKVPPVVLYQ